MCRAKLFKRMIWVRRFMVCVQDRSYEAGTVELITFREWQRRMDHTGDGPEKEALVQAEEMEICTEVAEGEDIEMF